MIKLNIFLKTVTTFVNKNALTTYIMQATTLDLINILLLKLNKLIFSGLQENIISCMDISFSSEFFLILICF